MHKALKLGLMFAIGSASLALGYWLVDSGKLHTSEGKILWVIPDAPANEDRFHTHDISMGALLFIFAAMGAGSVAFLARKVGADTVAAAAAAAAPAGSPVK